MEMQAPNRPQYAAITRDNLNRLLAELTPLREAFNQATQQAQNQQGAQGGWKQPVAGNVSLNYRNKVKEVERQIQADIDAIDRMCTAHERYIQSLLDRAKGDMLAAKKAVGAFEDDRNEQNATQAARVTNACAAALERLAEDAVAADSNYGEAWFPFRSNLHLGDDTINQDYFRTQRQAIISRGKIIAAKVAKCQQLGEQAKAFRSMSAKFVEQLKGLKTKKAEVKQTAVALEAKLKKMYDDGIDNRTKLGWQKDGRNWKKRERDLEDLAKKPITKKIQSEAASWMTELEATLKIYRNQVKTMETVLAAAKKPLTPKQLQSQRQLFEQAEAHVAKARDTYLEAGFVVADAKKAADKIKQAKVV